MSIVTRTNRATNPSAGPGATGWAAVAGTGGTAALTWSAGPGGYLRDPFVRVEWTVGTTAVSGGISYTQSPGLSASTQYTMTIWVFSTRAQTMRASAVFKTSGGATVNTVNGNATTVPAGEYTPVSVTGTSGASVTQVTITVAAFTGGSNWQAGDQLESSAVLIETGAVQNEFYDGSTPDGLGVVYAWTGGVDASTSTATIYTPVLTLVPKTDAPCGRVEITISDLDPGENYITLWRTADGKRRAVRGARKWRVIGSDFIVDYEVPLSRTTQYDLEVVTGVSAGVVIPSVNTTVTTTCGYIQDPLDPESAVKLYADVGPGGEPSLTADALRELGYEQDETLIGILGSDEPVAMIGQRMAASGIPFDVFTDVAQQSTNLRNLLRQAGVVLIRPLPGWSNGLPGLCYCSIKTVRELPVNDQFGGQIIEWKLTSTLVAAPTFNVMVAVVTYADVDALWTTYQSAQTALSGKTYLAVKKSPSGV